MTNIELVEKLKELLNMDTHYKNKYPYNLGYVADDGSRSFDCWNLIKALLNGYDIHNNTKGYYQRSLKVTGDVDGLGLLKQCNNVSSDFHNLREAGTYLLYEGNTHAGIYVRPFTMDGREYNVIECTSAWTKNVLASWVDEDGTRRRYKGCTGKIGRWYKYGNLNCITYTVKIPMNPAVIEEVTKPYWEYTVVAGDTLWGIAQKFYGIGVKWHYIADYNGITSSLIRIGQKLKIPKEVL